MEMVISRVRVDEVCNDKKLGHVDSGICVTWSAAAGLVHLLVS